MAWMKSVLALALAWPGGATAQTWVTEPARSGAVARGGGLLRQAMVAGHNMARADFGAMPLAWDGALSEAARRYARELARTDRFRHAPDPHGQGENLWTGTRGAYGHAEMVGAWVAEGRDFRPGIVPGVSRTGRFADVGHYVQIVWPATRRFGCATASNRARDYLVCRYSPAGNTVGRAVGVTARR